LQAVNAAVQRLNGAVVASRVGTDAAETVGQTFANETERAQFTQKLYDRASEYWAKNPVKVDYQVSGQPSQQAESSPNQMGFGQSVPGMGSMFVMFTVFGGMQLFIVERKNWTFQRLVTMPVSRRRVRYRHLHGGQLRQ